MTVKEALTLSMFYIFILIALVVIIITTCSGCDDVQVGIEDNGLLAAPDGRELAPAPWPLTVSADDSVAAEGLGGAVSRAASRWNGWIGQDALEEVDSGGFIEVSVNGLPLEGADDVMDLQDELELTTVYFDPDTLEVVRCQIVLNVDLAYDEPTMELAVAHGVGHCLGLDDDPGPPRTVDLRSIMAKPADPLGELTDHDFDLLLSTQPQ